MGGLVIETVRPGVQFVPDAAAAFRRADAQVRAEFGRGIDVNSTYRSWADQMVMFINWGRYVAGTGPYPGHSKAVHPSESFHVAGIALDSDDWRIPRIVAILAENGFIRNRLHVPNENHHFEWLRNRDQKYGRPIPGSAAPAPTVPKEDDDMQSISINGNLYGVATQFITHYGTLLQAKVTREVTSATDELHDLNKAYGNRAGEAWAELLDGLGIPRNVIDAKGRVLNPQSTAVKAEDRFEGNGTWSREREILAALATK